MLTRSKLILTGFSLFICINLFAQNYRSEIEKRIDVLKSQGIDTLLVYTPCRTLNIPPMEDTCSFRNPEYLLWSKGSETIVQKFIECWREDCSGYTVLPSNLIMPDSIDAYNFLIKNFQTIMSDEILPQVIKIKKNGYEVYIPITVYDDCHIGMRIITRDFDIGRGYMENYMNDGTYLNIEGVVIDRAVSVNYEHNISSPIYKLSGLLKKLFEQLEKNKVFRY